MLKGKHIICKGTSQSHDVLVLQPAFVSFVHKPLQKREAPTSGRGLMVVPIVWWERMRTSDSSALLSESRTVIDLLWASRHIYCLCERSRQRFVPLTNNVLVIWILRIFALGICPNHILSVSICVTRNGVKFFWWRGQGLTYFSYWVHDNGIVIYLLWSSFYRRIGFELKLKELNVKLFNTGTTEVANKVAWAWVDCFLVNTVNRKAFWRSQEPLRKKMSGIYHSNKQWWGVGVY